MTPDAPAVEPTHRSIRFRFTASLVINISRAGLSFLAGIVVARGMGPLNFGTMTFLIGSFTAISTLMDMGSSNAFFTFISQRPRGRKFVVAYLAWQALQFALLLTFIGLVMPGNWVAAIWVGHERGLVVAALTAFFLQQQVWLTFTQLGFALRETYAQVVGLAVVVCHLVLVGLAWWMGILGVRSVLMMLSAEYLIAILVVWRRLAPRLGEVGPRSSPSALFREYWAYCSPLVLYCWFGFIFSFADNWMLQRFGGGRQQGYYAVAMQFSAISMFATVSMLQIFWKEVAEAHAKGDTQLVERLYKKVSRLLYAVAAAVGGFLIPWSPELIALTLGPKYAEGVPILQLILLYPLHQTMGQVNATMFFATSRTQAQVRIGIISSLAAFPLSYLVLAPPGAVVPGLGLGGMGSAIKLITANIATVNAISWWFCRTQKWKFDWAYQVQSPAAAALAGVVSYSMGRAAMGYWHAPLPVGVSVALACYLTLAGAMVWRFPEVVGLSRQDVLHLLERRHALRRLW